MSEDTKREDMLEQLLKHQLMLMERLNVPIVDTYELPLTPEEEQEVTKWVLELGRAIVHEAVELEDWLPWKHWSQRNGNKVDVVQFSEEHLDELRTEAIDLLHFVLELLLVVGMDAKCIVASYMNKMEKNHARQDSGTY